MKQNLIHIGLDVDDIRYHGAAFNKDTGEVIDFKYRPTLKGLLQQLDRLARHVDVLNSLSAFRSPEDDRLEDFRSADFSRHTYFGRLSMSCFSVQLREYPLGS